MRNQKFFDRELSWLSFNYRVLQEAKDPSVPLFEKIKFIAIFSSNLDEFFRVRVASLRSLLSLKKKSKKELDFDPEKLLTKIRKTVNIHQEEYGRIYREEIIPALNRHNIHLTNETELNKEQSDFVKDYFYEQVLYHISPMMIVKRKVSPFLKSGILYLAVKLLSKDKEAASKSGKRVRHRYAMIEIPSDKLPRFIQLPGTEQKHFVIFLDDIIRYCLPNIFPGYKIIDTYSFKLTRDAELYIDDEFSGNLLEKIKRSIKKRTTGVPCRFLYDKRIPKEFLRLLKDSLSLTREDLVPGGRYHNYNDFFGFPNPGLKELEYPPMPPLRHKELDAYGNVFQAMKEKDFLLHVPYQSYDYVVDTLNTAAEDPSVTEIKITQYRVASKSRIVKALLNALKNSKRVTVFIELKARFDEETNIEYAGVLESAGAKVLYSFPGLKVHAKIALIYREEEGKTKHYAYLATGNFNEKTAELYSDFGFFTSNKEITNEVNRLFQFLEGNIKDTKFSTLLVAKFNMRRDYLRLIDDEISNAKKGKKAYIALKMNSLEEPKMIEKLYEASNAGVKIDLIIRGICCLVPGVKGQSKNINIISIVDRFLEHSRIFYFYSGGEEKIYLSSADWMKRNLRRRIEASFPIKDERLKHKIKNLLHIQLHDNTKARIIDKKQENKYKQKAEGEKQVNSQKDTYEYIRKEFP